jgi:hypothetical protein
MVAMLSLAGSAGGSASAPRAFRIIGMSYTHPRGGPYSYSWVCAKIKKTTTKKATVTASGPGATYRGEKYTRTLGWKGTKIVAFKIVSGGLYTIRVRQGTKSTSKRYTVPPPTGPGKGPFPCV